MVSRVNGVIYSRVPVRFAVVVVVLSLVSALQSPACAQAPTYLTQWGSPGEGPGQLSGQRGLATDVFGNVYVADTGSDR